MQPAKKKGLRWALILVGLAMVVFFGARARESYRQLKYLHEQGFDTGDAEVNAIRPWMTIHFVAAAYAVPEDYLFAELGLEATMRDGDLDVEHLNQQLGLGPAADGRGPAVIDRLRRIVLAYRANPVVTGLADVRDWMTLNYIANSSGIPSATLTRDLRKAMGPTEPTTPGEIRLHKPLSELAADLRYPGGPRALGEQLQAILTRHARDAE